MDKLRILTVDDDEMCRKLIVHSCSEYFRDYSIREAENALDAISILENYLPNLVFLDNQMPYLNGSIMAKWMKHHPVFKVAKVCFFSSCPSLARCGGLKKGHPDAVMQFLQTNYCRRGAFKGG